MIVLALIVSIVGLLVMPSSFHRIAHDGEASGDVIRLIGRVMPVTLTAFALAMALDLGLGMRIGGPPLDIAAGILGLAVCLGIWLGPNLAFREEPDMPTSHAKTPMAAKIDYGLTEARVVLPGAQALLGFQPAIALNQAFGELPRGLKLIHGLSLKLIDRLAERNAPRVDVERHGTLFGRKRFASVLPDINLAPSAPAGRAFSVGALTVKQRLPFPKS